MTVKVKVGKYKVDVSSLHNHCPLDILHLETPDEYVDEVDEGKLDEGAEDGDKAEDDEDVHGCCITYLQCKVFRGVQHQVSIALKHFSFIG